MTHWAFLSTTIEVIYEVMKVAVTDTTVHSQHSAQDLSDGSRQFFGQKSVLLFLGNVDNSIKGKVSTVLNVSLLLSLSSWFHEF